MIWLFIAGVVVFVIGFYAWSVYRERHYQMCEDLNREDWLEEMRRNIGYTVIKKDKK